MYFLSKELGENCLMYVSLSYIIKNLLLLIELHCPKKVNKL